MEKSQAGHGDVTVLSSILIVDDERPIVEICQLYLRNEGYTVYTASNGEEAEEMVRNHPIDFIVIDVMMPKKNGYEFIEMLHHEGMDIPFLYLTALNQEKDTLYGLALGADDYITKPFSPRELAFRIKNILKRVNKFKQTEVRFLREKELYLNKDEREARLYGEILDLTNKEFDLLWTLVEEKHRVLSKSELLKKVWGYEYYEDAATVNVHIHHLREKLAALDKGNTLSIKTVWGIGYQFKGEEGEQ
ncbi:response regulator transcription factor [Paenibacillus yonginensis]|uniref:response regulator transcription factor n=1 Tax=Paenibacillus yonginensis TaxID=1462996 RepID=UPI00300183A5